MKHSRLRTFLIGFIAGLAYAVLAMLTVRSAHRTVSIAFIFVLPMALGAIPVLFSTREGLRYYRDFLLLPVIISFSFFLVCFVFHFDGFICLTVIVAPFVLVGCLAAFLSRMGKLKSAGKGTALYCTLFLPFLMLFTESLVIPATRIGNVVTKVKIDSDRTTIWENTKNVRDIRPGEVQTHFIHLMGIPKPLDGRLNRDSTGGTRSITWEKGIRFSERIKTWHKYQGFTYEIDVDPKSIPPSTLDEHVMIGGEYFDVLDGGYRIDSLAPSTFTVTLNCRYRVTTSLNWYSAWWADVVLNQFNESILEVIKKRCEKNRSPVSE